MRLLSVRYRTKSQCDWLPYFAVLPLDARARGTLLVDAACIFGHTC
jgi:hypothetical protein